MFGFRERLLRAVLRKAADYFGLSFDSFELATEPDTDSQNQAANPEIIWSQKLSKIDFSFVDHNCWTFGPLSLASGTVDSAEVCWNGTNLKFYLKTITISALFHVAPLQNQPKPTASRDEGQKFQGESAENLEVAGLPRLCALLDAAMTLPEIQADNIKVTFAPALTTISIATVRARRVDDFILELSNFELFPWGTSSGSKSFGLCIPWVLTQHNLKTNKTTVECRSLVVNISQIVENFYVATGFDANRPKEYFDCDEKFSPLLTARFFDLSLVFPVATLKLNLSADFDGKCRWRGDAVDISLPNFDFTFDMPRLSFDLDIEEKTLVFNISSLGLSTICPEQKEPPSFDFALGVAYMTAVFLLNWTITCRVGEITAVEKEWSCCLRDCRIFINDSLQSTCAVATLAGPDASTSEVRELKLSWRPTGFSTLNINCGSVQLDSKLWDYFGPASGDTPWFSRLRAHPMSRTFPPKEEKCRSSDARGTADPKAGALLDSLCFAAAETRIIGLPIEVALQSTTVTIGWDAGKISSADALTDLFGGTASFRMKGSEAEVFIRGCRFSANLSQFHFGGGAVVPPWPLKIYGENVALALSSENRGIQFYARVIHLRVYDSIQLDIPSLEGFISLPGGVFPSRFLTGEVSAQQQGGKLGLNVDVSVSLCRRGFKFLVDWLERALLLVKSHEKRQRSGVAARRFFPAEILEDYVQEDSAPFFEGDESLGQEAEEFFTHKSELEDGQENPEPPDISLKFVCRVSLLADNGGCVEALAGGEVCQAAQNISLSMSRFQIEDRLHDSNKKSILNFSAKIAEPLPLIIKVLGEDLQIHLAPCRLVLSPPSANLFAIFFRMLQREAVGENSRNMFHSVYISPLDITVDYTPRRLDCARLSEGHCEEALNLFSLQEAPLVTTAFLIIRPQDWGEVWAKAVDKWFGAMTPADIARVISGSPGDWVARAAGRTCVSLGSSPLGSGQPGNTTEGLILATSSVASGVEGGLRALAVEPLVEYQREGAGAAIIGILQGLPLAFLRPLAGLAGGVGRLAQGLRNSGDHTRLVDLAAKYR